MTAETSRSLVNQIHQQLRTAGPAGGRVRLAWQDQMELEARVRALHDMGEPFRHVGLSQDVRFDGVFAVSSGVGGGRVATEV